MRFQVPNSHCSVRMWSQRILWFVLRYSYIQWQFMRWFSTHVPKPHSFGRRDRTLELRPDAGWWIRCQKTTPASRSELKLNEQMIIIPCTKIDSVMMNGRASDKRRAGVVYGFRAPYTIRLLFHFVRFYWKKKTNRHQKKVMCSSSSSSYSASRHFRCGRSSSRVRFVLYFSV